MKKFLLIPAICAMFASCDRDSNNHNTYSDKYPNENNQTQPNDWEITTKVKKHLMSDSSLSSHARLISVTTNNGVVTLTGSVASQEESRKVVRIVKNVPGVTSVDNQLTISNS